MKRTAALVAILFTGILLIWVAERWAWSLFQFAVFILAACLALRARRFTLTLPAMVLALAAAWPLVQLALRTTLSRGPTWESALDWWTFLVVFLVAATVHPLPFLRAISVGGMAVAVVAVVAHYSAPGSIFWLVPTEFEGGIFGPFVNRNQYAAWIELLLPAALYLAVTEGRSLYAVAATAMFASVIASGSRAGAAIVCLQCVAAFAALALRRRNVARAAAAFAVLAAGGVVIFGWQELAGRLEIGPETLRRDAVRASLQMARDYPLAGAGLGTWGEIYPRYAGLDTGFVMNQAHNDWAQWAAEGGVPFLLLMVLFAALLCKRALASIYGLGVIAVLLHAFVDYPMQQRPALSAWFFAMAGVLFAHGHDVLRRARSGADGVPRGNSPRL